MGTDGRPGFGEVLRRYRTVAGLTQEALAERAHLSARAVAALERGVNRAPRRDTLRLLAEALALSAQARAELEAAARRPAAPDAPAPPLVTGQPPLVGRTRERALLGRHLAGEGPLLLLLAGEPGIGKSRLLQEAAQRAPGHGWQVLQGGCQRRGGQEPYTPVLEALDRYIHGQTPLRLRTELRGCAWLVRLLPELAAGPIEPLPPWTLTPEHERRLLVKAVQRFLANVAGPAGTLLVLDDLQWAGGDALDLLATLVRSAADVPVRVVGAYRDTEVRPEDALCVTLANLTHAGLATQCPLGPLTMPEARRLLAGLLAGLEEERTELRERVVQRAGGVPFFLVSSAQWLRRGDMAAGAEEAVPWDVAHGLRQRVAALPTASREVLGAAAVVGRVVPPALLMAVADQADREVLVALEGACRARLLIEEGNAYHFAHDVIREVIEADVGIARRMMLHRRVAEALEQRPGEPAVELLAFHYGRSGEQEKAARYLELAGDRAQAQYANAAAEGYYRQAVDRLRELGRAREAATVYEKLGAVLITLGRYDAALAVLEQAAETHSAAGDLERLAHTLAQLGHALNIRGTPEEGVARLQPLVAHLEASGASYGLAALHAALAELLSSTNYYSEAVTAAEQAVEFARAVGNNQLLSTAEERRAWALLQMGGPAEEALRAEEEACRAAEAAGDLEKLFFALGGLTIIYTFRGKFDASLRYYDRVLDMAERLGNPVEVAATIVNRAMMIFWMGNWDQARRELEGAVAMRGQTDVSLYDSSYPLYLGCLSLAEGEWDEAGRYLENAAAMAERRGDLQELRWAQGLLAERDLLLGCPGAARARLVLLLDRPGLEELFVTRLLPILAGAHLELGEIGEAEQVVAQALRRMRADHIRLDLPDALRVQAMVLIRQGRWAEAVQALEEGLVLARSMPYPYAEARLLHVYGEMHVLKGEPEPARERLEAALAIFDRLGARKDAERAQQAITDLLQP